MDKQNITPNTVVLSANISSDNLVAYNNNILGEILTIVDASMPKSSQSEAMKSLIKQSVWRNYTVVWSWMNEQSGGNASTFPLWNSVDPQ